MSRSPFAGTVPHDVDAEASVLGGIIRHNDALARLGALEVNDFYSPKHQAVFTAIRRLEERLMPFDMRTVSSELERIGRLEAVGGEAFVMDLTLRCPSVENTEHYARILADHRMSRDVLNAMADVAEDIRAGHLVGVDAVRTAAQHLMAVQARVPDPGRELGQLMLDEMAAIERDLAALDRGEPIATGVPIGVETLDIETGGYPVGSVSVILGGAGHGKSTLMGTGARAGAAQGDLVLVYSCEDPHKFWAQRSLAQESGVHTEAIARRRWLHAHLRQLADAVSRAGGRREVIIPSARWSMQEIIRDVRGRRLRDQAKHNGQKRRCSVWVDYVQVLRIEFARNGTREQGVAQAMDEASWLAQGCGSTDAADEVAVIMASQVKQSVIDEERAPRMNDAADSFAIGKVAKFMLGINRPAEYDDKLDPTRGRIDVLKRNQGDKNISAEVELHLATHTIRAWSRNSGGPQQSFGLPEEGPHGH